MSQHSNKLNKTKLELAKDLFLQEDYDGAITIYDQELAENPSQAKVMVNKAVAEFKQGEYGLALANICRAKKLLPRDKKVNHNFELIQNELGINQPNLNFLNYFSVNEILVLLIIFNVMHILRWRLSKSKVIRFLVSTSFVIVLLFSSYLFIHQKVYNYAVVTKEIIQVYSGNNDSFSKIGELLEGQIIKVKTKNKDWSQIIYKEDLGWVKDKNLSYF